MTAAPETLWRRWRGSRQSDAFEALVAPHLRYVADLARRQGVPAADADDVVQETLLELARERSDEPVRVGVRPWLARRVRFRAKKAVRSSSRRRKHEGVARRRRGEGEPDGTRDVEVREEVEAALALLRPVDRQAVILRYLHDMDYVEVAYVLGLSENACRIKVHRGIGKLRRSLGGHAAALVAALGLPGVAEAALIQKTTAAAAAASTAVAAASAAGIGKGVLMGLGTKLAGAAAVGAAVAAVGMMAFYESAEPRRTDRTTVREPTTGGAPRDGERTDGDAFAELKPTADEAAWLRKALAEERARRANAAIQPGDSGLDILERRQKWGADVSALVQDFDRFASHVKAAPGKAHRLDAKGEVTDVALDELPAGTAVIEFGPGKFQLGRNRARWSRSDEPISHLEIRGAGRDRTTVVLTADLITAMGRIEHLRIHDLTLDGGQRGALFLDVRGAVAAVFENVRFKRWPSGGFSSAIGLSGAAYVGCRDCEFLGGYGHGGSGVIALRGTGIASFERCLFADLAYTVYGGAGAAAQSVADFRDCTWENTGLGHGGLLRSGAPEFPITVRGGRVHCADPDRWATDLNGVPLAQVENVTFAAILPRCRLADVLRVVRGVSATLDEGQRLQGVQLARVNRDGPREFVVYLSNTREYVQQQWAEHRRRVEDRLYVILGDAGVKIAPPDRNRRVPNYRTGPIQAGARGILDVVGRARLDPDLEAYGIAQSAHATAKERRPAVVVRNRHGRKQIVLDAVTGEVLEKRK